MRQTRRQFFMASGLALRCAGATPGNKNLEGVFPIAQTPFTAADKLDLDALVEQYRFLHRGGVHGIVWPQLASEWNTLNDEERMAGAEALGRASKELRPALVLGVQATKTDTAVRYAKEAKRLGADAIISLPPQGDVEAATMLAYYKELGAATDLPLFVQAVGKMSVAVLIEMSRAIPTFRYVKDEAGQPLFRIGPLKAQTSLKVFTGAHGKTLIDEMQRGFSGTMPAASFADLYAWCWDLWHQGKRKEAMEAFGRISMLISEIGAYGIESLKYILQCRGVFSTYRTREKQSNLDETGKQVIREMLDSMKPWLRA